MPTCGEGERDRLRDDKSGVVLPLDDIDPPAMDEEPGTRPRPSASSRTTGSIENLYRARRPEATAMPPATTSLKAVCRTLLMSKIVGGGDSRGWWLRGPGPEELKMFFA